MDLKIKTVQDDGGLGICSSKKVEADLPGTHRLEVTKTNESYKINLHPQWINHPHHY
ncbi:MAG: hypothetical protein IPI88_15830 [Chitinophagaceae bacterium]|nr:hypothetical protein [Chitinophagaceae bacterium]